MANPFGSYMRRLSVTATAVVAIAVVLILAVLIVPAALRQTEVANAANIVPTMSCVGASGTDIRTVSTQGVDWYHVVSATVNLSTPSGACTVGALDWFSGDCTFPAIVPSAPTSLTADNGGGSSATQNCTPSGGGGGATVLAPLDPPGTAPRVLGGYETNPGSHVVVYNQDYGYQFYAYHGQIFGLVDFNTVGIPCAGGLILSMNTEHERADLYYDGGDQLRVEYFYDGEFNEANYFSVAGIGDRACEAPGGAVPGSNGSTSGGVSVVQRSVGTAEVVCRQNLRQGANTDTPVLLTMDTGARVHVVSRSNDNSWLEVVTTDGIQGWAYNGQCMSTGGTPVQQAPIQVVFEGQPTTTNPGEALVQGTSPQGVSVPAGGGAIIGVTCRQNLRTGPTTDSVIDRTLTPGTMLTVIGRSEDGSWLQVANESITGWTYFGQCVLPQQGDVTAAPVTVALGG